MNINPSLRVVSHQSSEHQGRVSFVSTEKTNLFTTNPRNEVGKFGIATHNSFTRLFHSTIKIVAQDAKSLQQQTYYLNRKSAIHWINGQIEEGKLDKTAKQADVLAKLQNLPQLVKDLETQKQERLNQLIEQKQEVKAEYPTKITHTKIGGIAQKIRSSHWGNVYKHTLKNWTSFKLRFGLKHKEKVIADASAARAAQAYKQALKVPAYQAHVEKHLNGQDPKTFDQVPLTSKKTYILPAIEAGEDHSLYLPGTLNQKTFEDSSTGTSGQPTKWKRGIEEREAVLTLTRYAAHVVLKGEPYTLINGFALGQWATGMTVAAAVENDAKGSLANIGPDVQKMYDQLVTTLLDNQKTPGKEKQPIILTGYPPHIKSVVDMAVKKGFALDKYNVVAVVGGESMSEEMRDLITVQKDADGHVTRTGFQKCYSSYGASDLDINIGYESDFEIWLRKLCHNNQPLSEELFGKNEFKPMIFHYDPLNYHIENDAEGNLIYTCTRQDRISPRVRYNLGDRGKVMAASDVLAILEKHGVELTHKPNTNLPFVFVWGRQDSAITFRGSKVAPENLSEVIVEYTKTHPDFAAKIAHYGFYQYMEPGIGERTEIVLELKEDADFEAADQELLQLFLNGLKRFNADFKKQMEDCPVEEQPTMRVFKAGTSPMHAQQDKYKHLKKQYIFREKTEFVPVHAVFSQTGKHISLV